MAQPIPQLITDIPRVIIVKLSAAEGATELANTWSRTNTARDTTGSGIAISVDDDFSEVVSSVGFTETPETSAVKAMGLRFVDNIVGSVDLEVEVNINAMSDEGLERLIDSDYGARWAIALEYGSDPTAVAIRTTRMARFIVFVVRRFQNNMSLDADQNWTGSITYKGARIAPIRE